jgi:hypothetical protein
MSINISGLPNKIQSRSAEVPKKINSVEEETQAYTIKCNRVKNEILRKINSKDQVVKVRVGFLTHRDKYALIEDISKKGYSCHVEKGLMTIQ